MAISRRAFGLGLLGVAAAGTGGYLTLKDRPEFRAISATGHICSASSAARSRPSWPTPMSSMRSAAMASSSMRASPARSRWCAKQALLSQNPQFLWPSSSIMVDLARKSGVAIRNDQVVLNSPIVVYTWGPVVEGLKKSGLVTVAAKGGYNQLDLKALLDAILAGKDWSDLGIDELYGRARIVSTDPNRSNSGFMFAGLVLSLMSGDVATQELLAQHGDQAQGDLPQHGPEIVLVGKTVRPVHRRRPWRRADGGRLRKPAGRMGARRSGALAAGAGRHRRQAGNPLSAPDRLLGASADRHRSGGRPAARGADQPEAAGTRLVQAWFSRAARHRRR